MTETYLIAKAGENGNLQPLSGVFIDFTTCLAEAQALMASTFDGSCYLIMQAIARVERSSPPVETVFLATVGPPP